MKKVEAPAVRQYELTEAEIVEAKVEPDPTTQTKTKLMKVVSITRTPGGRIARIDMNLKAGPLELEIDEPLARAIVKIFDDDDKRVRASNVLDLQDELAQPDPKG